MVFFTDLAVKTKVKSINFANACNYTAHLDLWRIQEVIDCENGILTFCQELHQLPWEDSGGPAAVIMQWDNAHTVNFSLQATKGWRKNFSNVNIKKKLQLLTDGTVQRNQFVVSPGAQLYVYSQLVHRNYPAIPTSFSPFHSWFWGHINVFLKQTSNREWITA